ncbi:L-threonine dehydratase catabolic TdcB [Stieleria neptunia]|uniref:L-threonine dehydratase catabolic TdcB n=1 Tax=Stieleria neptunia TaxID=2527979 RepID=A0A518HQA1_9BACT|nr:threonine/serine dehydratase [Stieleria neptunia]QDV43034.1 L-threonine dehydratase catabolic TdcB [Stieleria neptunia]
MSSPTGHPVITLGDIRSAEQRIADFVVRTPAIRCEAISDRLGCDVSFKAENLQHVGAFKARGAVNAVMSLSDQEAERGVVTHSSGNHAAAIARAARLRGIPAFIVMPEDSSPKKIAAVESFGVAPVFCGPSTQQREQAAAELQRRTGAILVHPFETPAVMAGQGTVGLELLEQISGLDAILVPVGGGGLLAGVLVAVKTLRPDVKVFAVEPALADDTARSLKAGSPQPPTRYDTVADGLRTQVGDRTFPIIEEFVDDLFLVSEADILSAMRTIAEDAHLVAEPSGAVAFAGLVDHAERFAGQTTAVIISGGNLNFGDCQLGRE